LYATNVSKVVTALRVTAEDLKADLVFQMKNVKNCFLQNVTRMKQDQHVKLIAMDQQYA
jgi:hypothetical protein